MTASDDDTTRRIDWAAADRFLAGEGSPADRAAFEEWLAAHPDDRALIEAARAGLDPARDLADVPDPQAALARAQRRLRSRGIVAVEVRHARSRWTGVAPLVVAALVIAAVTAVGVRYRRREPFAGRSYVTDAGQRLAVALLDGTQLTLAPESRLDVPADYSAGNRSVRLVGEAYFAVVHDARHPFAVRAGHAVTTDIGTAFDVRAYPSDRDVRIAVAEGRVRVERVAAAGARATSQPAALAVGDIATLTDTALAITHGIDATRYTSWTRGELVFRDEPAEEVLHELARWYDLNVSIADSTVRQTPLTATYSAADPLDAVLDAVGRSLGERVERRGRDVTVSRPARGLPAGLVRDNGTT